MKIKIFLSLLFFGNIVSSFSQKETIELTFRAEYHELNIKLDSILIENLTQQEDTALYAPDTILVLDYVSSIIDNNDVNENTFTISQNYPNPFVGETEVELQLCNKEWVQINVQDIFGRVLLQYENTLIKGNHSFTFYSDKGNYYVFSVRTQGERKSIKMINPKGIGMENCKLIYNGQKEITDNFKERSTIHNFGFKLGDQLRFTGFANTVNEVVASNVIDDNPETNKLYTFKIIEGIPCPGIPDITYEGQIYHSVLIGDQCWMKENLNVGSFLRSSYQMKDNGTIEKYCYDEDTANCNIYGGYYQWNEIMQYLAVEGTQGICPDGWHIPSDDEWRRLEGFIDSYFFPEDTIWTASGWRGFDAGKKLKSTRVWSNDGNGSNPNGFCALPAGYGDNEWYYQDWLRIGSGAAWWSSSDPYPNSNMYYRRLISENDLIFKWAIYKDNAFNVRCIKDD